MRFFSLVKPVVVLDDFLVYLAYCQSFFFFSTLQSLFEVFFLKLGWVEMAGCLGGCYFDLEVITFGGLIGQLLFCIGYFTTGGLFFVVYQVIVGKLLLILLLLTLVCFAFFSSQFSYFKARVGFFLDEQFENRSSAYCYYSIAQFNIFAYFFRFSSFSVYTSFIQAFFTALLWVILLFLRVYLVYFVYFATFISLGAAIGMIFDSYFWPNTIDQYPIIYLNSLISSDLGCSLIICLTCLPRLIVSISRSKLSSNLDPSISSLLCYKSHSFQNQSINSCR